MEGFNKKIEQYKKYLAVLLQDEYGFSIDEIEDILQTVELAKIEVMVRGADLDETFGIIRKAVTSKVKERIREREELCVTSVLRNATAVTESDTLNKEDALSDRAKDFIKKALKGLSKKEQGIIMGRFVKTFGYKQEDILEYTDVVAKLTDAIAVEDPELANLLYDRLCITQNPIK